MEVLSGMSLREALARTPKLRPASATGIGIGIIKALVFAHDKKVVHCDLKPDNVFIIQREDGMMVKLLDFGVMKAMLVAQGYAGAAGTLTYMAPEQLRREDVDARADLFSFGVTLYEMLAGKHPFAEYGRNEKGALARIDKLPQPLNAVAPEIPWQVANVFDDMIQKLLQPKRDKRYRDASAVLVKLHEAKRTIATLERGSVHDATTNPAGPPGELIAQTTGVIDDETLAGKTDPHLDLSSEPALAAAVVAASSNPATAPPSKSLPPPDPNIAYVDATSNSYERAAAVAKLLEPKPTGGLELTSGEREYVDNLAKHMKAQDGGVVLRGRPRGGAPATVVEGDAYHRRMRWTRELALTKQQLIALIMFLIVSLGVSAYLLVYR